MSDTNKLEVEISVGSTGEIQALTKAIDGLAVSFKALDAINTGGLLNEFRALSTSMKGLEKSMDGLSATLVDSMRGAMKNVVKVAEQGGKQAVAALTAGMGGAAKAVGDGLKGAENAALASGKKIKKNIQAGLDDGDVVKEVKVRVSAKTVNLGAGLKASVSQSGADDLSGIRATVAALREQAGATDLVGQAVKNLTKNSVFANRSLEEQLKTARLVREISKVEGMTAKQLADDYGTKAVWASRNLDRVEAKVTAKDAAESEAKDRLQNELAAAKMEEAESLRLHQQGLTAKAALDAAARKDRLQEELAAVAMSDAESLRKHKEAAATKAALDAAARKDRHLEELAAVKMTEAESLRVHQQGVATKAALDEAARKDRLLNELAAIKMIEDEDLRKHKLTVAAKAAADKALGLAQAGAGGLSDGVKVTDDLTAAKGRLRKEMHELHSAARGLASGFGAMWLTWGSILPLMAGAAVSTAFVQTLKMGAEVQESLTRLKVLGGESAEAVAGLNTQMLELSRTGPFGPREVAEAMKTLTLAGLSAAEVSGTIKDVLNFSLAGDVGIQDAADALTTIATAFGVGAQGFNYVSDTISKAAAESKSSVESMAAAFKTAAVINQQYGVSLEETAVGLSLLANAGIKSTSAGTALRNMYADLSGRTQHVRDTLKELGVTAFDPLTGKMRETGVVFKEMMLALETKNTPDGGRKILGRIFGERGEKEAFAIFEALRAQAKATGTDVGNAYDELLLKVTNAAGFAAVAAAEISLSPLNQMKSVTATLQSVLVETFESLQPYLLETSARLKEIFNSDQFKGALQSLVTLVGSLVTAALEHGKAIATVVLSYLGLRAALSTFASFQLAFAALTTAASGAAVAITSVGVAARVATATNPLLLALSAAVTAAAVGWSMYQLWKGKADQTVSDGSASHAEHLKALQTEAQRLENINTARERGITLQALEQELNGKKAVTDQATTVSKAREAAAASAAKLAAEENSPRPRVMAVYALKEAAAKDELRLTQELARLDGQRRDIAQETQRIQTAAGKAAIAQRSIADEERKKQAARFTGSGTGEEEDKGAKARLSKIVADNNKELEAVKARYTSEASVIKDAADWEKTLLKSKRDNLIISAGAFHAKEILATAAAEKEKIAEITKSLQEAEKVHAAGRAKIQAEVKDAKALKDALGDADKKYGEFVAKLGDDKKKIESGAVGRLTLQAYEAAGELAKLKLASKDFWDKEAENSAKASRQDELDDILRYASPEARAYLTAAAAEHERLAEKVSELEKQLKLATVAQLDYTTAALAEGPPTEELAKGLQAQIDKVKLLTAEREKLKVAMGITPDAQGRRAVEVFAKNEEAALVKSVSGAIESALFEGGEAGSKSLRKVITDELRKPISIFIQASVQAMMGAGLSLFGSGSSSSSSGSGGTGLNLSQLSGAKSMFDAVNGGFAAFGASVGQQFANLAVSSAGQSMGLSTMVSTGPAYGGVAAQAVPTMTTAANSMAASVSSFATVAGAALAGISIGSAIAGDKKLSGLTGTEASAIGTAIGYAAGGPIGAVIGGAIGGAATAIFGQGETKLQEQGVRGTFNSTTGANAGGYYVTKQDRGWFGGDGLEGTGKNGGFEKDRSLTAYLNTGIFAVTTSVKEYAKVIGLSASAVDGFSKSIDVSIKDLDPAAQQKAISDSIGKFGDDMVDAAYGPALKALARFDETTGTQTLTRLGKDITAVNGAFGLLGTSLVAVSLDGAAAASNIVAAFGGLEKFTAGLGSYYENFYTPEEKRANTVTGVTKALNDAGGSFSTDQISGMTKEAYRTLVEGTKKTLGADSPLYVALINASQAVAGIIPEAEDMSVVMEANIKLLNSQGRSLEALSLQRSLDIVGMTAAQVEAYDYARAIDKTIESMSAAREVQNTRTSAYIRLLTAQGNAQEALTMQRDLDIYGMSVAQVGAYDYSKAIDKAIESMNEAKEVQSTRTNADIRLLTAQGKTQEALTKQREQDIVGMTAAQVAAYDYSKAIDKTIESMVSAAALQTRLSVLTGAKSQTQVDRAAELKNAPDEISRKLLADIYAQEDRITAVNKAFENLKTSVAAAKETLSDKYNADLKALDTATTAAAEAAAEAYTLQAEAAAAAYEAQEKAAKESVEALKDSISKTKDLVGNLRSTLESMTIGNNEQALRTRAQALLQEALTSARAGGALPLGNDEFDNALKTLAQPSQDLFTDSVAYARDFFKTRSGVEELATLADKSLTDQEKLLEASELAIETAKESSSKALDQAKKASDDQVKAIKDAGDVQKEALKAKYDADVSALDKTLERAQTQIDATNGVYTAVVDVSTAINNLAASLTALVGTMQITASGGTAAGAATYSGKQVADGIKAMTEAGATTAQIVSTANGSYGISSTDLARVDASTGGTSFSAYQAKADAVTPLDAATRAAVVDQANATAQSQSISPERALYDIAKGLGLNAAEVDKYMGYPNGTANNWATSVGLPAFSQGINRVPRDMDARIHEGEAVIPEIFNPFNPNAKMAFGGSDDEAIVAELRAVREELRALRALQKDGNTHAKKSADLLNQVTSGGDAMVVESQTSNVTVIGV